jgi:hypothetical protein
MRSSCSLLNKFQTPVIATARESFSPKNGAKMALTKQFVNLFSDAGLVSRQCTWWRRSATRC